MCIVNSVVYINYILYWKEILFENLEFCFIMFVKMLIRYILIRILFLENIRICYKVYCGIVFMSN